ncbi:probable cytochrome P450 6a17 isoform X1 [Rhodnius prolixus]|uniref:probable cytochrome P450 6a17 isoform X1 n=1 Tax=Rhodnius prolixus TaxID=13249 RepID=UPI003D18D2FF
MLIIILAVIALGLLCLLDYYKRQFWMRKGVPNSSSIPYFGHVWRIVSQQNTILGVYEADTHRFPEAPYFGVYEFWRPTLVVQDFNLIEHILIKDFSHFLDHPRWVFDVRSIMHDSLFNMKGEKWRALRYRMIPWFTSNRIKSLFPFLLKCVTPPKEEFEAMAFLRQVAADAISTFFGIELSDKQELQEMNKRFHDVSNFKYYKLLLVEHFAKYTDLLGLTLSNRSTDQFFRNLIKSLFSNKNHSLVQRMDRLLNDRKVRMRKKDLYTKSAEDEVFSYEVTEDIFINIVGQMFIAGLDTTSNTMTWLLYELAMHPEIQAKAREEIRDCLKKHGDWTYDAVQDMKYVAGCINESMRFTSDNSISISHVYYKIYNTRWFNYRQRY